jgi:predicted RNA-binding Zn ribbon-like protein
LVYADTRYWRGSDPATETLSTASDLLDWCGLSKLLEPAAVGTLANWSDGHEREAEALFTQAIGAREAIYKLFRCVASGKNGRPADVVMLNDLLARAPRRVELAARDGDFAWHLPTSEFNVPALLAPVFWSTADLLVGKHTSKVRLCANEKCRWLFLDDSKSGTRRWCSMSSCGNRAKAHRHYLRKVQAAADIKD